VTRVVWEALAAPALMGMWAGSWRAWEPLPDRYPAHFNARGEPDRWGGKRGMLVLPLAATGVFVGLTGLTFFNPRYCNLPLPVDRDQPEVRALLREMAAALKATVILTLAYLHQRAMAGALGRAPDLGGAFLFAALLSIWPVVGFHLWRLSRYRE
jgi:uncharacterized membrane protein